MTTIAVAQLELGPGELEQNRARTMAAIDEAASAGAELVILPELASSGYHLATAEAVDAAAEAIPGPATDAWREAAAGRCTVVGGVCERDGDAVYNSVAVVGADGLLGRYRKLHLFDGEQLLFAPGDAGLPVFDLPFGRIGIAVCYDLRFVETARILALRGADLIAVPTAWTGGFDPTPPADGVIDQARAAMVQANLNSVWMACASRVGLDGEVRYLGSSCVADPYGRFALEPCDADHEAVVLVDVDIDAAQRAKTRGPRIRPLHDRRTDVYDELLGYRDVSYVPPDLRAPGLSGDLHRVFGELREHDPVHLVNDGTWLVTRYEDVAALLKDRTRCDTDIFLKRGYDEERPFGRGSALETFQHGLLVNQGGEHHRHHRSVFTAPFTRAKVDSLMVPIVQRHAAALIDALPDEGEVDWVQAVAKPLPLNVFAELFAIPTADVDWLYTLLHEDSVAFDVLLDPALVAAEDIKRGEQAMLDLRSYLDELSKERRERPGDDMLSILVVSADQRGALSWDDGLSQAMEALTAGTGTTQTLINAMIQTFSDNPESWDRVAADPELVKPAVEECLRYVSPALGMGRIAVVDFELHGKLIKAGDVLQCGLLPANRDPRAFPDPDRFDITRTPNRHVAFGGGVHSCLGSHLARLEAREALTRALARWERITVDPATIRMEPMIMLRSYAEMPVRLVARGG